MLLKPQTNEIETPTLTPFDESVESPTSARTSNIFFWVFLSLMGMAVLARFVLGLIVAEGGGDFYYYVVTAREWLRLPAGELPSSPSWTFYNPGIFRFYQTLMLSGVTSSHGLLIAIVTLNLINALLVSIILWRLKVHPILSVWAGIWALFIAEHYYGFGGYTEPLIVLPMLLGLTFVADVNRLWWRERSLLIFGAGLAFSIYAKQQGSLYAFGAFCAIGWVSNWRRLDWLKPASILTGVVAGVFLLLLAAEPGTLMEVLLPKIRAVQGYPIQDASLWGSLGGREAADPKLGYLLIQLVIILLGFRFVQEGKRWLTTPAGAFFALCAFIALASAWQMHTRPYRHYLLLTWPPLIIAVAIAAHAALQNLSSTKLRRLAPGVLLFILVFPFIRFGSHRGAWFTPQPIGVPIVDAYLETWGVTPREAWLLPKPTVLPIIGAPPRVYQSATPAVKDAMVSLREDLPEWTKVIIMPSVHNVIYRNLNLQHPLADYGFAKDDSVRVEALESKQAQAVIFITDHKKFRSEWMEQAQARGFIETKRYGPVALMRR